MKSRWSECSNAERQESNTVCVCENVWVFVERGSGAQTGRSCNIVASSGRQQHQLWGKSKRPSQKVSLEGKKTRRVKEENCRGREHEEEEMENKRWRHLSLFTGEKVSRNMDRKVDEGAKECVI